jgi:ferredoxin
MRLMIEDYCVRCGICIDTSPDLFEMDEANEVIRIKFDPIPESLEAAAKEAAEACAVSAMQIVT